MGDLLMRPKGRIRRVQLNCLECDTGSRGYIRGGVFNEVTYTSPAILAQIKNAGLIGITFLTFPEERERDTGSHNREMPAFLRMIPPSGSRSSFLLCCKTD